MFKSRSFALLLAVLAPLGCASPDESESLQSSELAKEPDAPPASAFSYPGAIFGIEVATSAWSSNLAETVEIPVTIQPNAHVHDVDLAVRGLPPGVVAEPLSMTVEGKPATARIRVKVDATAYVTPKNTTVPIEVVATSGEERATIAGSFKVNPYIVISIPRDISLLYQAPGGPLREEWGAAFGPNFQPLRTQAGNPITVAIFNGDTKKHILHGPGGTFPHGDFGSPIMPGELETLNGQVRPRSVKIGDSVTAYIHGEYYSDNAAFKITVAPTE